MFFHCSVSLSRSSFPVSDGSAFLSSGLVASMKSASGVGGFLGPPVLDAFFFGAASSSSPRSEANLAFSASLRSMYF